MIRDPLFGILLSKGSPTARKRDKTIHAHSGWCAAVPPIGVLTASKMMRSFVLPLNHPKIATCHEIA
ncbi:MAG TPA: hypothetical protein DIT67_13995 [Octadecabacter sp.]|nr:hypothetical protein [Octadecabacter sp.]